jgi:UDP-N-acetylglucosamine transferase subunit ALG13
MILVTVGTESFPFDRLMLWIENLIKEEFIQLEREEVVIQYGSCRIFPQKVKAFSVIPDLEFRSLVEKARLIIAHCGEGTIDLLGKSSKPFILVPRCYCWGEHVDDHQIELAEMLATEGIPIAYSPEDIVGFLASPQVPKIKHIPTDYYNKTCQLLDENLSMIISQKQKEFPLILVGKEVIHITELIYRALLLNLKKLWIKFD